MQLWTTLLVAHGFWNSIKYNYPRIFYWQHIILSSVLNKSAEMGGNWMTDNITSKELVMQAMTGFKYGFVNINYVFRNPTKNCFLPFSHHCLIKFHSNPPIFVIYLIVVMWVNSTNVYDPMTILLTLLSMKKKCSFQIQYGKHLSISIHCFCYSYLTHQIIDKQYKN